jgi:dethiobiotin synthetase
VRSNLNHVWPNPIYVTGTDTHVGKTYACAALCAALGRDYWKPVQAGLDGPTDSEIVAKLSGARIWPERYRLRRAASPHAGSRDEDVVIQATDFVAPTARPLVVEGAGGWMVPYATHPMVWQSDVVRALELPVVVVARTSLGTLNHTLSTLRAIRADSVRVAGLILVGEPHPENEADLASMGETTVLARLPRLDETAAQFATLVETIRACR